MPQEQDAALKGAYKSFVISRFWNTGIKDYANQVKLHVKALVESVLKEMQPGKRTNLMTLWLEWKKPVKSVNTWNT